MNGWEIKRCTATRLNSRLEDCDCDRPARYVLDGGIAMLYDDCYDRDPVPGEIVEVILNG